MAPARSYGPAHEPLSLYSLCYPQLSPSICCNRSHNSLPSTSSTPWTRASSFASGAKVLFVITTAPGQLAPRDFHCDPGTSPKEPQASERPRDTPCSSSASPSRTQDTSTLRCGTRTCSRPLTPLPPWWFAARELARIELAQRCGRCSALDFLFPVEVPVRNHAALRLRRSLSRRRTPARVRSSQTGLSDGSPAWVSLAPATSS